MTDQPAPVPAIPYGRDWPGTDLWADRDGQIHRGTGPYHDRLWRRLRRRFYHRLPGPRR